jgi:hypothetical protein
MNALSVMSLVTFLVKVIQTHLEQGVSLRQVALEATTVVEAALQSLVIGHL